MTADYDHRVAAAQRDTRSRSRSRYDPKKITYGKILQIYFSVAHDPTQLNRQGPDSGPQYRSAIFNASDEQKRVAQAYIAQLDAAKVYPHADRDQGRSARGVFSGRGLSPGLPDASPERALHRLHDIPKVENLKKLFADYYLEKPTLVSSVKVTN